MTFKPCPPPRAPSSPRSRSGRPSRSALSSWGNWGTALRKSHFMREQSQPQWWQFFTPRQSPGLGAAAAGEGPRQRAPRRPPHGPGAPAAPHARPRRGGSSLRPRSLEDNGDGSTAPHRPAGGGSGAQPRPLEERLPRWPPRTAVSPHRTHPWGRLPGSRLPVPGAKGRQRARHNRLLSALTQHPRVPQPPLRFPPPRSAPRRDEPFFSPPQRAAGARSSLPGR